MTLAGEGCCLTLKQHRRPHKFIAILLEAAQKAGLPASSIVQKDFILM
jgi:hypothetical protein